MKKKSRILIIVCSVILLTICVVPAILADYTLMHGYDFATGENLTRKLVKGKVIWEKRTEGVKKLYKKYHLSYPEPMIQCSSITDYVFEIFCIKTMNRGWKFWRWRYYILRYRPGRTGDGACFDATFFRILRECKLTEADAKRIFLKTISMEKSGIEGREVQKYLIGQYDLLKAADYKQIFQDYLNKTLKRNIYWEWSRRGIFSMVISEREKWPKRFPKHFYEDAYRSNYVSCYSYYDFFKFEYIREPSEFHAALLAHNTTEPDKLFKMLYDKKKLDLFLKQIMPKKLPPLPAPAPKGSPVRMDANPGQYWAYEYKKLPYRKQLLQWRCFKKQLKEHWEKMIQEHLDHFYEYNGNKSVGIEGSK